MCRYIDLLSKLWAYSIKKSDLAALTQEAVNTLAEMELMFPAWDLDINRHMVLHIAQHLQSTGPCWAINMLPFERLWKTLISWLKQTRYPETTMMFNFNSFRAALRLDALMRDQGKLPIDIAAGVHRIADSQLTDNTFAFLPVCSTCS